MTIEDQIKKIKQEVESIKTRKIQTATRLRTLEQEKENLLLECNALNVDPAKIEDVIKEQEVKIEKELQDLQKLLNEFNTI
jgi:chromosome segregation ATPase